MKDKKLRKFLFGCEDDNQIGWGRISCRITETLGLVSCDKCGGLFPRHKMRQIIVEVRDYGYPNCVIPTAFLYCPHCAPEWDKEDIDGTLWKLKKGKDKWIKIKKGK